ncbi:unnamed protein product, partial [Symbiodinium microadriaticum]
LWGSLGGKRCDLRSRHPVTGEEGSEQARLDNGAVQRPAAEGSSCLEEVLRCEVSSGRYLEGVPRPQCATSRDSDRGGSTSAAARDLRQRWHRRRDNATAQDAANSSGDRR